MVPYSAGLWKGRMRRRALPPLEVACFSLIFCNNDWTLQEKKNACHSKTRQFPYPKLTKRGKCRSRVPSNPSFTLCNTNVIVKNKGPAKKAKFDFFLENEPRGWTRPGNTGRSHPLDDGRRLREDAWELARVAEHVQVARGGPGQVWQEWDKRSRRCSPNQE